MQQLAIAIDSLGFAPDRMFLRRCLGDRVLLIEEGRFGLDIPVDLPRSHERGSAEFAALKGHILNRVLGRTVEDALPA